MSISQEELNDTHIKVFKYWRDRWCHQHIANLSSMKRPGNTQLSERKLGGDFLVVGAGPSLRDSAEDIRGFGGGIICTSHALKFLLSQNIRPDIVIVIDAGDAIAPHFNGCDMKGIELWACSWIRSDIMSLFDNVSWFFDSSAPFWPEHALVVPSHATCAHAAAKVSLLLGADRVFLIGCDMAFDGEDSHWHGNQEHDHKEYHKVLGINGSQVSQSKHFAIMLQHWVFLASDNKGKIFNATKRGAAIEGAEHVRLGDIETLATSGDSDSHPVQIQPVIDGKQAIWAAPITVDIVMQNPEFAFFMPDDYIDFAFDGTIGSFNVQLNIKPGFRIAAIDCADRMLGLSIRAESAFGSPEESPHNQAEQG